VHLNAQIVDLRITLRQTSDHFPDAKPDLETAGRTASKNRIQVQRRIAQLNAVGGPQLRQRPLLCGRHPAGAQDEAPDAALNLHGRKVCLISCRDA
jgi:hypothetical protein